MCLSVQHECGGCIVLFCFVLFMFHVSFLHFYLLYLSMLEYRRCCYAKLAMFAMCFTRGVYASCSINVIVVNFVNTTVSE